MSNYSCLYLHVLSHETIQPGGFNYNLLRKYFINFCYSGFTFSIRSLSYYLFCGLVYMILSNCWLKWLLQPENLTEKLV